MSIDFLNVLSVKDQLKNRQSDAHNLSFSKHFSFVLSWKIPDVF